MPSLLPGLFRHQPICVQHIPCEVNQFMADERRHNEKRAHTLASHRWRRKSVREKSYAVFSFQFSLSFNVQNLFIAYFALYVRPSSPPAPHRPSLETLTKARHQQTNTERTEMRWAQQKWNTWNRVSVGWRQTKRYKSRPQHGMSSEEKKKPRQTPN